MGRPKREWNIEAARQRFLTHVDVRGAGQCWPWTGALDTTGYGAFNYQGKKMAAHRAAYLLFVGPIPFGQDARHTCDNRPCVNWEEHIIPGTRQQNIADVIERGRRYLTAGAANGHAHLTEGAVVRILLAKPTAGYRQRLMDEFGVSRLVITQIRTGRTWSHLRPEIPRVKLNQARPGEQNPWAKLTEQQVIEIFMHPKERNYTRFLADKYGVSLPTICNIRAGRDWGHITKDLKRG